MQQFDFIGPTDQAALLAISTPEWQEQTRDALLELGFKVHAIEDHAQFHSRFYQVNYQVIVIDETFCAAPEENISLKSLQMMPMAQRRHVTIVLLGSNFETLNSLQAFVQSVHCVVNYSDMPLIGQIVQKVVVENSTFLSTYLDVQRNAHSSSK